MQSVWRRVDRCNGGLIVADRETCRVAGGRAVGVAHPGAEHSAVILWLNCAKRIGRGGGSGNIRAVALPLVKERPRSGRRHGECCRAANRRRLVLGMQSDAGSAWGAGELHAINRAASTIQIVKRTIRAHFQVHRGGKAGRERGDLVSGGRVEFTNPPAAVISEEIDSRVFGWKLAGDGIVEGAPGNRASPGMGILVDWIAEIGVDRTARAFTIRPAVIRSGNAVVNRLPGALADVVDEDPARIWLDGERERVAKAQRPNGAINTRGGIVKRIVTRYGPVGVDTKYFAQEISQRLSIRGVRVFPHRHVKFSIQTEVDGPSVMVACAAQPIQIEDNRLAAGRRYVAAGSETADPIMRRRTRHGVVDVNPLVVCEIRIKRHSQQTAFAGGVRRH